MSGSQGSGDGAAAAYGFTQAGAARFAVSWILTLEPDRGVNFFNIAPRLMMHADDLPVTQLIQVGS